MCTLQRSTGVRQQIKSERSMFVAPYALRVVLAHLQKRRIARKIAGVGLPYLLQLRGANILAVYALYDAYDQFNNV